MKFSEQDKAVLRMVAELIWRQGIHAPQDSMLANAYGQLVERIHKEEPCPTDAK